MKRLSCIATTILLSATVGLANIARPEVPQPKTKSGKAIDTTLQISLDRKATEARLLIPRSQVRQLRAALDDLGGNEPVATAGSFSNVQTIVSASLLSLAMIFGGLWFIRSKNGVNRPGPTLAVGAAIVGIGAASTWVFANAGPPPEARSITGKMFSQAVHIYGFGSGKIKLEVVDDETTPKLIVPNQKEVPKGEE